MTKYEIYEYSGTADYDFADRDYEYLADKFGEVGKSQFIAAFDSLDAAKAEIENAPHYYRTTIHDRDVTFYSINAVEYDDEGDLIQSERLIWSADR